METKGSTEDLREAHDALLAASSDNVSVCAAAAAADARLDYMQFCQVKAVVRHHICTVTCLLPDAAQRRSCRVCSHRVPDDLASSGFQENRALGTVAMDMHDQYDRKLFLHVSHVRQAATACPLSLAGHLSASAFLRFRRSGAGAVSAAAVHAYLDRRTAMLQLVRHMFGRLTLLNRAFDGRGRCHVAHLVSVTPSLPGLRHVPSPCWMLQQYDVISRHPL